MTAVYLTWQMFCDGWTRIAERWLWNAIAVEVSLHKLAEETSQWPDEWPLYLHGVHDENPHVWFDGPRVRLRLSLLYEIIWKNDQVCVDGVYYDVIEEGADTLIVEAAEPDGVCPCGLRKSTHDRIIRWNNPAAADGILKLARPIVIPVRQPIVDAAGTWTSADGGTIRVMIDGLTTRDVQ